jgi:hypothetical protein
MSNDELQQEVKRLFRELRIGERERIVLKKFFRYLPFESRFEEFDGLNISNSR